MNFENKQNMSEIITLIAQDYDIHKDNGLT